MYIILSNELSDGSSSGIFILIAKNAISNGGIVYGAAYDKNFQVNHVRVSKEQDLRMLQELKYVQRTIIKNIYAEIKADLHNHMVLFSGTLCRLQQLFHVVDQIRIF